MIVYCLLLFALVWLVAVFKVFVLDDGENAVKVAAKALVRNSYAKIHTNSISDLANSPKIATKSEIINYVSERDSYHRLSDLGEKAKDERVPLSSEWIFIRSNPSYKIESYDRSNYKILKSSPTNSLSQNNAIDSSIDRSDSRDSNSANAKDLSNTAVVAAGGIKKPSELAWPPVNKDGSIPESDGIDIMPITGLKVPRFWYPEQGTDLNTVGSKVNGEETIYLMIASYRDFQCKETIASAFNKADHPERLFVGAVDQTVPGDSGCLDVAVPCSEDPNQPLCKYRDQISVFNMDAVYATGPVTARHVGDRMYRSQYFVMQMDAHCLFVRHWDTYIIKQWRSTGNEMAVLSSYLTDIQGSIDGKGDSTRNTRPIMCNSDFEGIMPARYLRHGAQPECMAEILDMPQLQPFWAAGFSFSRGHFKLRVPYDGYQPMVFQGEEIAIGIRGFTHGYDFYAPKDSVVFHEYAVKSSRRKKVHMFWENSQKHAGEGQKSLRRSTAVIGMAPDIDPSTWDHSELDKYGLGNVRDKDLFYKIFLIDPYKRKAVQLCPFVKSGIMHRAFQPHLRPDGLGIDYSKLVNYDTRATLRKHLYKQHAEWERRLKEAINNRNKELLKEALDTAEIIMLNETNPELVKEGKDLLPQL